MQRCHTNRTMNKTNSSFDYKNGQNFKLKHRKDKKLVLSERLGDPYGTVGDGCRQLCRIRESWYMWKFPAGRTQKVVFNLLSNQIFGNYFVNGKKNTGLTEPSLTFFSDVILT